jgi:hypothetical protein
MLSLLNFFWLKILIVPLGINLLTKPKIEKKMRICNLMLHVAFQFFLFNYRIIVFLIKKI